MKKLDSPPSAWFNWPSKAHAVFSRSTSGNPLIALSFLIAENAVTLTPPSLADDIDWGYAVAIDSQGGFSDVERSVANHTKMVKAMQRMKMTTMIEVKLCAV